MKSSGVALPEVHDTKKILDTSILPEKQKPQIQNKQVDKDRPRLEQGRAGIRHKKPQPVSDNTVSMSESHKYLWFKPLLRIIQIFQYQNN